MLRVLVEATLPFLVYWACAGVCTLLKLDDVPNVNYAKNGITRRQVALATARLSVAASFANVLYFVLASWRHADVYALSFGRLVLGAFALDTSEYWIHRAMHTPHLYERFHKKHHALRCPYSFAALYHDPLEATLTSSVTVLLFIVLNLTWSEYLLITTAAYVGALYHHVFGGRDDFHWVHHETAPECNFSQPWWHGWDLVCGTKYVKRVKLV